MRIEIESQPVIALSAVVVLTTTLAAASYCAPAHADDNAEARVYFAQGNRALTRGMNARGAPNIGRSIAGIGNR